jgi:nucleoside-diphosphate-sugar epimerase
VTVVAHGFYRGKRVLVCGGAGFLGAHLVRALLAANASVEVIDPCVPGSGGSERNLAPVADAISWHRFSIEDRLKLATALKGCDYVFDAMGFTRHHVGLADPLFDLKLNYVSHVALAVGLNEVPRPLVYLGTRGQFGRHSGTLLEDSPQVPLDPQGIHKSAAESLLRVYSSRHGWPVLSARLDNCFGPGQPVAGDDIGLIGGFIRSLRAGENVMLYGDVGRSRKITYAPDAARWLLDAAERMRGGFSAVNMFGEDVRLVQLLELLIAKIGRGSYELAEFPPEIALLESGASEVSRKSFLEYVPHPHMTPLAESILTTLDYFQRANA